MFHLFLELTWKWPVLSCLCKWRFKLVLFDINTWIEHLWKVFFCWESVSGLQLFGVSYGLMLPCEMFFLPEWKTFVIAASLVWTVCCSAFDVLHHSKVSSTPFRSWRGSDLFSPVSPSCVLCLWCLGITDWSNIFEGRIFAWTLFPVYSCFGVL